MGLQNHSSFTGFSLRGHGLPETEKRTIPYSYAGTDSNAYTHPRLRSLLLLLLLLLLPAHPFLLPHIHLRPPLPLPPCLRPPLLVLLQLHPLPPLL